MVGWHPLPNGHEFEQAPGVGDGQGGLACCSPWGPKESDTTERLENNKVGHSFSSKEQASLISWWQSPSAGILEPPKINSLTVSIVSTSICHEVMGLGAIILVF